MSEQANLPDPERWSMPRYAYLVQSRRVFLDPIHNEPFHPYRVPTYINELLYRGLEPLANRADYFGYEAYGYRKEGPAQYDRLRALTSEALEASNEKLQAARALIVLAFRIVRSVR